MPRKFKPRKPRKPLPVGKKSDPPASSRPQPVSMSRLELPFAEFAAMQEDERTAIILIGHALNEINALRRVGIAMANDISETNADLAAIQTGQAMVIMRLWLGKLFETWEVFRARVQSRPFNREVTSLLSPDAVIARDTINRVLANQRFSRIRNEFAFHAPATSDLEAAFRNLQHEPLSVYVSDIQANTFFQLSEAVITLAMLPGGEPTILRDGFLSLINDSVDASDNLVRFLGEYWTHLVNMRCPGSTTSFAFEVTSPSRIEDVRLPAIVADAPRPD